MKVVCGVDLIEIERMQRSIERYGERFLERVYTEAELAQVKRRAPSLAARFAAKEAVSKALGTGIGPVHWKEIEIMRGPAGAPVLNLYGNASRLSAEKNILSWSISLSHSETHAIAMVVALYDSDQDDLV